MSHSQTQKKTHRRSEISHGSQQNFSFDLLEGKTVIVTGGSGIGRVIAQECVAPGARVAIGARKLDRLEETASALRADGGEVYAAQLDIRDPDAAAWVDGVSQHWDGQIDARQ